jgi:Tol biopolymer transport system component
MRIDRAWPVLLLLAAPGLAGAATVELVSGTGDPSTLGGLSAAGRSVVFQSTGTGTDADHVYLRDTVADATTLLRVPPLPPYTRDSGRSPLLSADGRFVAFLSSSFGAPDPAPGFIEGLYLYDRVAGTFTLVNHAPGLNTQIDGYPSIHFTLSADGRYVAYQCSECSLVPGHPGSPRSSEVFLYDRLTGLNTLVSHASSSPTARPDGQSSLPAISDDGRYVTFWSNATNLIPGQIDTPGTQDLFVFDRLTGGIELVTHVPGAPDTAAGRLPISRLLPADLSADGRFIAFVSYLPDLVPGQVDTAQTLDVFLRDQVARTTVLVSHTASSQVTAGSAPPFPFGSEDGVSMGADGRFLVYESLATDLVAGASDTNAAKDVFLYDRLTGTSSLVSHAAGALQAGSAASVLPRISADGSHVAFLSLAADLVPGLPPGQTPGRYNLYVQDRSAGTTTFIGEAVKDLYPYNPLPVSEDPLPYAPQLSANGRRIAFTSEAALVPEDSNGTLDVYLWDQDGIADPEDPVGPIPVPPCRLLDTRRRAERPILTSNVQRTVTARGRCGVPVTAKEVVVKVTVFNPSGKGNLRLYPGDTTAAPSAILRFDRGTARTETFTLPLSTNGTLTILPFVAGRGTVHVAVEVTGYSE